MGEDTFNHTQLVLPTKLLALNRFTSAHAHRSLFLQPIQPSNAEDSQSRGSHSHQGISKKWGSEGRKGIPEEDKESVPQDGPHPGFGSKSLLVPESADRQTPPTTEADPYQEEFNLAPWRMPPERPEPPKRAPDLCGPSASDPKG